MNMRVPSNHTQNDQGIAQLVECRTWTAEAKGSSPFTLTNAPEAELEQQPPTKR